MLKCRKLGNQGLTVSELGLGCMGMNQSYGLPNEQESIRTIHRAIELGVNFFDTAEVYGPYTNEELLGKAIRGERDKIIIATKFGYKIENNKMAGLNSQPEHIKCAVDGSLKRLGTEYIDLLYQHRVDPEVPIEEVIGVLADLIKIGKIRFIGLSEAGVNIIRRANATYPVSVLQSEYSLWEHNLEIEIIPLLLELGIGLVPFAPLGRGFLTGHAKRAEDYPETDFRRKDPRFMGRNFDQNMEAAKIVRQLAVEKNATSAQIALAWLLQKGEFIVPIPGTKHVKFLEENIASCNIHLTPEQINTLDNTLPPGRFSGERYNPQQMSYINR